MKPKFLLPFFAIALMAGCLPSADFKVSVKVIDQETGQPIRDAWVFAAARVQADPPFEAPYNTALAGARSKTDAEGVAKLTNLAGLSSRGEPRDIVWRAIEDARQARAGGPKKRRIASIEGGSIVVFARGYGAFAKSFGFKDNPSYLEKIKKNGVYLGPVHRSLKGEEEIVELSSLDIREGTEIIIKLPKPDEEYALNTLCTNAVRWTAAWAASSKETGTSASEKRQIVKYIQDGIIDFDEKALGSCGEGWFGTDFEKEFLLHDLGPNTSQDPSLRLWLTEKSLEILPPGYEEIKRYVEVIKGGVVAEGANGRDINHYYDPYDTQNGDPALKWAAIGYPENPNNEWGWEDALRYYKEGDKGKAYKALGHVLRILEDLSIPMRTHGISYAGDSKESRFELYFAKLAAENNGGLPQKFGETREPARMADVKALFDSQARMSFGKFQQGYNPEINFDDYYDSKKVVQVPADAILESMGAYLFPKSIANGAGLLERFYDQAHLAQVAEVPGDTTSQDGTRVNQGESPHFKAISEALRALSQVNDEGKKAKIYGEIGRLPLETPGQLQALYEEITGLEKKVTSPDQKQYVGVTQHLCRVFATATDPKFSGELASVLKKEYQSMPKDFIGPYGAKQDIDIIRYEMRMARLQALTDAVGRAKDREALSTLRSMIDSRGIARDFAVGAIGQIGDPADLEDFIQRIKRDPRAHYNLNFFGPMAVDRIMQEVENPSVSHGAKGNLISSLQYMAVRENMQKFQLLLKHPDHMVREMAANGICRAAKPGDEDVVIEVALDSRNMNQLQALRAMNRIWSDKFIPALRQILAHDPDGIMRAQSAKLLAMHKVREAIPDLEKAQFDHDGEVSRAAAAALRVLE